MQTPFQVALFHIGDSLNQVAGHQLHQTNGCLPGARPSPLRSEPRDRWNDD